MSCDYETVHGHLFTGCNYDDTADFNLVRVNTGCLAVFGFQIGVVRTNIHKVRDTPAAFPDGITLKQFSDLIKEHDCDALGIITGTQAAEQDGAKAGYSHEEVFIKGLTVYNAFPCLSQDIIPDNEIGYEIQHEFHPAIQQCVRLQEVQNHHTQCCNENPDQYIFLFMCHGRYFLICKRTGSEIDCTLIFYFLTVGKNTRHDLSGIRPFLEGNVHFQSHEIDGAVLNPCGFSGCIFHLGGTVGTIDFDFIALFHDTHSHLSFMNI